VDRQCLQKVSIRRRSNTQYNRQPAARFSCSALSLSDWDLLQSSKTTQMDHSIFISYSSTDKAVAEQICASLEASGAGCWIAPRDIEPGADYPAAILRGIQQAQVVVFVVSPAAVESPHILTELGHAFSKKKPIVPFRLAATDLPPDFDYFLSLSQWLDAHSGCTPENLAKLKQAVAEAKSDGVRRVVVREMRGWRVVLAIAVAGAALAAMAYRLRPSPTPPILDNHDQAGGKVADVDKSKNGTEKDAKLQSWVNAKDGQTYIWVRPGRFVMGCSEGDGECGADELPRHKVEIPAGFWMGQTEVTNAAYRRIVPSMKFPQAEAKLPVVEVSWHEAKSYCAAVGGRLPTEAEWEYAARAGNSEPYYGLPSKIAWFGDNSDGVRHAVATKDANAFGLYDMLGNASEWVQDRYFDKYDTEAPPTGKVLEPVAGNASALTRGGFWESTPQNIRVSHRAAMDHDEPAPMAGIRCVIDKH
jgi:formylglycine-generating enzyme required for sulfatase activity